MHLMKRAYYIAEKKKEPMVVMDGGILYWLLRKNQPSTSHALFDIQERFMVANFKYMVWGLNFPISRNHQQDRGVWCGDQIIRQAGVFEGFWIVG